jgi:hypothetical protein
MGYYIPHYKLTYIKYMNKYKVEYIQTETFIVDVEAQSEQEATDKAMQAFDAGSYYEMGDCNVTLGTVYDVTNTDDPFNP